MTILPILSARLNPADHHLLTPDATLDDLGFDAIDREDIAIAIADERDVPDFSEVEIARWETVGDVMRAGA